MTSAHAASPTNSFLPAHPYAKRAAGEFREACELILAGHTVDADQLIRKLDSEDLIQHYNNVAGEWTSRDAAATTPIPEPVKTRPAKRMPGTPVQREIYQRDSWHCRWCETPVISKQAIKRMNLVFPVMFGRGPKNADYHGLILSSQASIDHVTPHSLGGTNETSNLVTACWPCQFARGNDDYARLGLNDPRTRKPLATDWDGCSEFRP